MKLLKKVPALEVKRTFVISDFISHQKYARKQMGQMSPAEYRRRVKKAKEVILQLPEMMLDMILKGEWPKRFFAYDQAQWYVATADTSELGVWKSAGGLPKKWTTGSLKETGALVADALKHHKTSLLKERSHTAIPGIIKNALPLIQKEKYLFPIAFKGGTGTLGRRGLPKMKADLDDGCMRSVALAASGKKKIKIYFGLPKKKSR